MKFGNPFRSFGKAIIAHAAAMMPPGEAQSLKLAAAPLNLLNRGPGFRKMPKRYRGGKWVTRCRYFRVLPQFNERRRGTLSKSPDADTRLMMHKLKRVARWAKHSEDVSRKATARHIQEHLRDCQEHFGEKFMRDYLAAARRSGSALV